LGCEAAEGSLVPSRKREYKPCGKHTEGKRPLYAIGFNFMDARYYDVFATVGGNRVSHLLFSVVVLFSCFFAYEVREFFCEEWRGKVGFLVRTVLDFRRRGTFVFKFDR
jgi:hypothetical protein